MQIEDITVKTLENVDKQELLSLRLRFTQLWGKNFHGNSKTQVGLLNRKSFIQKYKYLLSAMRKMGINLRVTQIDRDIMQKAIYGLDVSELPDMTVIPDYVTVVGSYVKNPKEADDIDIVFRDDDRNRDTGLELKLSRVLSEKVGKEVHYIYNSTGPHSTNIPLYDLVLRPKDTTKRTIVRETYNKRMTDVEEEVYYAGLDKWSPGFEAEYEAIKKELSGDSVLDLGCGTGRILDRLGKDYEVKGIENNKTAMDYLNRKGLSFYNYDLNKVIPLSDNSYDIVICTHCLEHLNFPGTAIEEAKRIAKDKAIFIVPLGKREDPTHKLSIDSLDDFKRMIPDAKCSVIQHSGNSAIAVIDMGNIQKAALTPFGTWTPPKPTMAGFTEAFSVDQIWDWAKDRTLIAEQKYNGFRNLIGKEGDSYKIYTDGKKIITENFPQIRDVIEKVSGDFLLDTSMGIEKDGKPLPRIKLMKLLSRNYKLEPGEKVVFTVFDMPYRDDDLSDDTFVARRNVLQAFYNKYLRTSPNFHISPTKQIKAGDKAELERTFKEFAKQPGSEGIMLKDVKSTWDIDGSESGWGKIKIQAEIKVIVLAKKKNDGTYNYSSGVLLGKGDYSNLQKLQEKEYVVLGKTFNTKLNANIGDILTVAVEEIIPLNNKLVWLGPRVMDIDDSRKEPYFVNQVIQIAENRNILQKAVGNIGYKLGDTGYGVLQIHIMGIEDKYIEELKSISSAAARNRSSWQKLKMFLKAHIGEQGAHLDMRLVKKGDNFFEGGEILIGNISGLDKVEKFKEGGKLLFKFKVAHAEEADVETIRGPVEWMDAGKKRLEIFTPGQAGATKYLHAAMMVLDRFTWRLIQADQHAKKLEVKGANFIPSGIYLIAYVPVEGNRKWMISHLKEKIKKFSVPDIIPIFIQKDNQDEHIICGVVYEPDELDLQGDQANEEEIRKAAYYFMEHGQNFGHNHDTNTITWAQGENPIVKVLESYIAPVTFQMACLDGHKEKVKKGSWVLTSRVIDEDLWSKVKAGEIAGYSMAGSSIAMDIQ